MVSISVLDLPEEILFKIFYFLPVIDLVVIANVNKRFYAILNSVIPKRGLYLHRSTSWNEYKRFLHKNSLASKLSCLNMDALWHLKLPAQITNCINLKILHIMDVHLSFDQLCKIFTSCLLLEDMEFVWPDDVTEKKVSGLMSQVTNLLNMKKLKYSTSNLHISSIFMQNKPKLESLTILVTRNTKSNNVIKLYSNQLFDFDLKSLKEFNLFVYRKNMNNFDKNLMIGILKNIYKCTLLFKLNICIDILSDAISAFVVLPHYFKILFSNCLTRQFVVLRILASDHDLDLDEAWDYPCLKEFIVSCKFVNCINKFVKPSSMPLMNSFHFFSLQGDINFITLAENFPNLRKLSFCCGAINQPHFNSKDVIAGISKLTSLEHLCIPPCTLYETQCNGDNAEERVQFKKPRMSRMPCFEPKNGEFNKILNNCINISTLEIATFERSTSYGRWSHSNPQPNLLVGSQSLCNIHKLKNLTHLTLEDIPLYNKFFVSLAEGCNKLEFLRIKNVGKNSKFEYKMSLAQAITHFKSLHSFRIDQNFLLPIGDLLSSLAACPKLERVFIASMQNEDNKLKSEDIIFFILNSCKLSFAWFIFGNVTKTKLKQICKEVKEKRASRLHFQILTSNEDIKYIDRIPIKYMREMVYCTPWILDSTYEDSY